MFVGCVGQTCYRYFVPDSRYDDAISCRFLACTETFSEQYDTRSRFG